MTPAQWARLEDLYAEALALDGAAREELVARVSGEDASLGAELRSLLDAERGAGGFLSTPAVRVASLTLDREGSDPLLGATLGDFTIEQRLGAGGMGVVYRARQASPQRLVALKVVRPDAMSPGVLRRFRHEADVLARLQHPGIAQIYEFGRAETPLGVRPYFAMELIDGKPLLRYVQDAGLGTPERLRLFALVCDAVQYAHQRGVIHRDLKPANILVPEGRAKGPRDVTAGAEIEFAADSRADRSVPCPKILDFGVARLTDSDVQMTTMRTDVGQLLGTLAYMSPEQAAGGAADLDVRSDVYALGVILYELLAGKLPYDLRHKPVAEAVRVISESDPTSLSMISRQFRGDIETIVAKALEKDRARRYQSAGELADDVRRHLTDRAILARPASGAYQLRKFARRNRVLVGGVAVAFVLLIGGIVGTSIGLVRAQDAERRAIDTAERAQRANKYLRDTIGWFKPGRVQSTTVSLRDVLGSVSERIDRELADQPDIAALMHVTVGQSYLSLADYDRAEAHAARALACCAGDPESTTAIEAMMLQVSSAWGRGNYGAGEPIVRRVIEIHLRTRPETDPVVAKARVTHAAMLRGLKRAEEAERVLVPAVEAFRAARPPQPEAFVEAANELAMLVRRTRPDRAIALMREAVEVAQGTPSFDAEATAVLLNNLAAACKDKGDLASAERLYTESLELRRRIYGDDHAAVALVINNLGAVQLRRGETEAAEASFEKALEMRRRLLGPEHRMTLSTLENLARIRDDRGDAAPAEAMFREIVEIRTKIDGPDHPDTISALATLAGTIGAQRRFDEARPMFEDAMGRFERVAPAGGLECCFARKRYASMLTASGEYDAAEIQARASAAWLEQHAPDRALDIAGALNQLARTRRAADRPGEAEAPARRALELCASAPDVSAATLAALRLTLAGAWNDQGRHAEAEPVLRDVVASYAAAGPAQVLGLSSAESELGACLTGLGKYEEAEACLQRAIERLPSGTAATEHAASTIRSRLARLEAARNVSRRPEADRMPREPR